MYINNNIYYIGDMFILLMSLIIGNIIYIC